MCTAQQEARIIVVGAGLAGLRCAQKLVLHHGLRDDQVVVLEASDRIGGRIRTDSTLVPGYLVDLGAELIHGVKTSLYNIAVDNGWKMEEFFTLAQGDGGPCPCEENDAYGVFYLGQEKRMIRWDSEEPDFVHLNNYFRGLGESYRGLLKKHPRLGDATALCSLSVMDGLVAAGVGEAMMGVAEAGYANTVGASLEDTSLEGVSYLESEWDADGDGTYLLEGSLGQVVEELSRGLEGSITTGWVAAAVHWSDVESESGSGKVKVVSRDGRREEGTHLVCTVPLSVLQAGSCLALRGTPTSLWRGQGCLPRHSAGVDMRRQTDAGRRLGCLLKRAGDHDVCALMGLFSPQDIAFNPPLPNRRVMALARMGMLNCVKMVLKFSRPFLPSLVHGCICSDSFVPEFWFRQVPGFTHKAAEVKSNSDDEVSDAVPLGGNLPDTAYLAIGFIAGPRADAVAALEPKEALARALAQLDEVFSCPDWVSGMCMGSATEPPGTLGSCAATPGAKTATTGPALGIPSTCYLGGLVHNWGKEPFVRGGYSYPKVGFNECTVAEVSGSLGGCVFFAGEHANPPTGMTAHAAMDSGERAAQEVIKTLREHTMKDA
ncbi:unnamed protein product [Discosporangium mesarthrocarpum]